MATGVSGLTHSRLLHVSDRNSNCKFLVDTGSEVSVIPPTPADRRRSPDPLTLSAVNNTAIPTYGKRSLTLNLGLRRSLPWIFVIADVKKPIIGADFLRHFGLMVDMNKRKLVDTNTQLLVQGILSTDTSLRPSLCLKDSNNPYLQLLSEFPALTQVSAPDTPVKHEIVHHIETAGPPVSARPRRLAPDSLKAAKREFEHMLQLGIIRPSSSACHHLSTWCRRRLLVTGDLVVTIALSIAPLSQIGTPYLTYMIFLPPCRVPLSSPNWIWSERIKIPVAPSGVPKTAITTPFGLFEFVKMPFGLRNAAQTFQRFMDQVLRGVTSVYSYIDDVLVASATPEQHVNDLRTVFERLSAHGIIINPNKCVFGVPELDFLGHHIDKHGITPLPEKVQAIRDFPQPQSQRQLRQFIGLVNFYHRFLPHCAQLMRPLHSLLSKGKSKSQSLTWTDEAVASFNATKDSLANASLLSYPKSDAPTCLMTDASDTAVGAVLQQHINGTWRPISFFSRKMTPAETRYSTFDREMLGVYLAIKHFRHFLEGRSFHILTDHKPLTFALHARSDRYSPHQARQLDYISQFTSNIRHV